MLKQLIKPVVPAFIWGYIRAKLCEKQRAAFARHVVEHTYAGTKLKVLIADGLAEGWYDHPWPVMTELDFLQDQKILRDGMLVFDCGAHQGVVALAMADRLGASGNVVAIEANAHNVQIARQNVELNPQIAAAVSVIQAAVAGKDGTLLFDQNLNGRIISQAGRAGKQQVPALSLVSLARQYGQPDLIFLDIEGAECAALSTAESLLRLDKPPAWFVEVHAGCGLEELGGTSDSVAEVFRSTGYDIFMSPEQGSPFEALPTGSAVPQTRHFLIALSPNRQYV